MRRHFKHLPAQLIAGVSLASLVMVTPAAIIALLAAGGTLWTMNMASNRQILIPIKLPTTWPR